LHRSLSVVLPLSNAGKALAQNVLQLVEVLSDLTERFEVLLVDEGGSEHATEVAYELAAEYPQVRVVRRAVPVDRRPAAEGVGARPPGKVVLIQQPHNPLRPSEVRRLWESPEEHPPSHHFAVLDRELTGAELIAGLETAVAGPCQSASTCPARLVE
jgi:hypothetical protein